MAIHSSGTVHGAARILGLTQTGVTQRIRSLESDLRTALFTRSRTGMKLTEEGLALLKYCDRASELEGEVLGKINGKSKDISVQVTIAGPTSVMSSRIVPACTGLFGTYPHLYLHFRLDDQENRIELLKKGLAQLAVLKPTEVPLELDSKLIRPDRYILVGHKSWKKRKLPEIIANEKIIDFNEGDETTLNYLRKCKLDHLVKRERLFANANQAVIALFQSGIGYGTLTEEVARPFLESGALVNLQSGHFLEEKQALVWHPRKEMPDYFRSIINSIH